jgi:hypothetical protein
MSNEMRKMIDKVKNFKQLMTSSHKLKTCGLSEQYDVFGYKYLEYGDEEEWVENFAYELHNYGEIPQDLETFIQEYKK